MNGGKHMFSMQKQWSQNSELECLIVGVHYPGHVLKGIIPAIDEAMDQQLFQLIKSGDIATSKKSVTVIHTLGKVKTKRVVFVGLGRDKEINEEICKESLGKALRKVKDLRINNVAIDLDSFTSNEIPTEKAARILGEVFMLSLYQFDGYKQKANKPSVTRENVTVLSCQANHEL